MLEGPKVNLRLFKEEDLDEYLGLESKESETEQFAPAILRPIPKFKKEFGETGFWEENQGRMLVTDKLSLAWGAAMRGGCWGR